MKINGIFIDRKNLAQVNWWNRIGCKLVKVIHSDNVVETATGKTVGYLFALKGLMTQYVVNKINSFVKGPMTTAVINRQK